jgi:hypothetical protein
VLCFKPEVCCDVSPLHAHFVLCFKPEVCCDVSPLYAHFVLLHADVPRFSAIFHTLFF